MLRKGALIEQENARRHTAPGLWLLFQNLEHGLQLGGVPECMVNREGKRQSRAMRTFEDVAWYVHTSASRPNASSFSVSQDWKSKSLLSVAISSEWSCLLVK